MGERERIGGKHCTKCKVWKPWSAFRPNANREDGHTVWCAKCDKEKCKEWYRRNRAMKLAASAEYSRTHRATKNASEKRRRARIRANGGAHSFSDWVSLVLHYDLRCLGCGVTPVGGLDGLTRDHIIPISLGGGNEIGNIQPLCHSCNTSKGQDTTDYRPRWDALIAKGELPPRNYGAFGGAISQQRQEMAADD